MNQENINYLNRCITCNEIEASIKTFPKKKSTGPDGFSTEFCQTFKEELILIILKLSHEIEKDPALPNSSCEASITLILKPDEDTSKKENYRLISSKNMHLKIFNKTVTNCIQQHNRRIIHLD
jgi:hypothetical protein